MTENHPPPDAAEARAQHRFEVLRELTEIGREIARDVGRQSAAASAAPREPGAPAADFALQFQRISRAVRQTLALEAKFDEAHQARREKAQAERAVETRLRGMKRKARAGEVFERILDEVSESDAERLANNLNERLEDADEGDFADRPLGEIVAGICRDLGVTVDWSLWEDEPWAAEALRGESPDAAAPLLSREAGEGDRPPESGGWRGSASSTDLNTS